MKITVIRQESEDTGTAGDLSVVNSFGQVFTCKTLELPWYDNRRGVSCIRSDTYSAIIWYSPTFKRNIIRLEDKHGRADCLIHAGNFAGDTELGYQSQIRGCTLVGKSYGKLINNRKMQQKAILDSGVTLDKLLLFIGTGPHTVQYLWASEMKEANDGLSV